MRETKIEKDTGDHAESLGWLVYKFVSPGTRGVPDRIYMKNGFVFFIEFKKRDEEPNGLQKKQIKNIREQKILVFVIDDIKEGIDLINTMDEKYGEEKLSDTGFF